MIRQIPFMKQNTPVVFQNLCPFRSISKRSKNLITRNAQVSFEYKEMMSQIYLREGEIGGPKDFKKGSLSLAFRRLGCDLEISLIQSIGFYNQTFERKLGRGEGRFVSVFLNASQHQN